MVYMMNDLLDKIPRVPVSEGTKIAVDWMKDTLSFLFNPIKTYLGGLMDFIYDICMSVPPVILLLIFVVLAFFISGRRFGITALTFVGLLFIYNQGLWSDFVYTLSLVLVASLLSVLVGIPIGILMAKSNVLSYIFTPILDFMQTMPAFVYLIPSVAFFGIGMVPGIFASLIFATPPTVRFTNLGIRQVPSELVEASEAFGSTPMQKLLKVEMPLAKATIMAGINQTVMLALSMVVVASMIGAPGLGDRVLTALQQSKVGPGFVAGVAIVIVAIIIDRLTQGSKKN